MSALWDRTVRFLRRIKAFVFPVAGWKKRIAKYRGGQTAWALPGAPEGAPGVGPWPLEWTPCIVTFEHDEEGKPTGAKLEFLNFTSDVSGRMAEDEEAVACARCGIHMHVADTDMETNLDVPLCPWCVRVAE
jgi:hypothetical protein